MDLKAALDGASVYFDANIFIYLMEGFSERSESIHQIRKSIAAGGARVFTSELTLCEVLTAPFKNNDAALISKYRQFIEASGAFQLCRASREIFVRASLYRARHGLKTPDAIHIATALEAGCSVFLTGDRAIRAPASLRIVQI